jgi:hypothetical protein
MYLDPSSNKAGAFLDTIYGAALSGALKVDPQTGGSTLKFLTEVQNMTAKMLRQTDNVSVRTPLGGGFAEEIGTFNQQLAAGGSNSARELLLKFSEELEQLKRAVAESMKSYAATDSANAGTLAGAGGDAR